MSSRSGEVIWVIVWYIGIQYPCRRSKQKKNHIWRNLQNELKTYKDELFFLRHIQGWTKRLAKGETCLIWLGLFSVLRLLIRSFSPCKTTVIVTLQKWGTKQTRVAKVYCRCHCCLHHQPFPFLNSSVWAYHSVVHWNLWSAVCMLGTFDSPPNDLNSDFSIIKCFFYNSKTRVQ